jgi:pyruvate dehydrogenase E2 component (dihydrolipoamide acetyltransferase)
MARELGINIDQVGGSGPHGRISVDDVKAQAKRLVSGGAGGGNGVMAAAEPLPDFTRWGEVERQPMKAVRRKTAQHVAVAWTTIPHVTQHDLADITGLEELRKRYAAQAERAGGSLTITAIAAKVVAAALRVFPQFNVSIDTAADELIYKKYVNIGIAVDTDHGLLVPVIRDVDTKNILQISVELVQLSEKARGAEDRTRRNCRAMLQYLEPRRHRRHVIHPDRSTRRRSPSSAISRAPHGAGLQPRRRARARLMLPLSLSYDHRANRRRGRRPLFCAGSWKRSSSRFLLAFQGMTCCS